MSLVGLLYLLVWYYLPRHKVRNLVKCPHRFIPGLKHQIRETHKSSNLRGTVRYGPIISFCRVKNSVAVFVGPCHHGMARPQVVDGGTASDMEGSCE